MLFRSLRFGTIDRDHAFEDGREHIEHAAVTSTGVDRQRAMRQQWRERREIRRKLGRRTERALLTARLIEVFTCHGIASADDVGDFGERTVVFTEQAPAAKRVTDDGVERRAF